jgi:hypothetical protein
MKTVRKILLAAGLPAILLLAAACGPSATFQSVRPGEQAVIVNFSGDVTVIRADSAVKAEVGMALYENDLIKTGPDAFCQIRFFNNSTMTSTGQSTVGFSRANRSEIITRVISGAAVFKVEKVPEEEFIVQTASNQFRVRGTEFVVNTNSQLTTVATLSGNVEALTADGLLPVTVVEEAYEVILNAGGEQLSSKELSAELSNFITNYNSEVPVAFSGEQADDPQFAEMRSAINNMTEQLDMARNELAASEVMIEQLQSELNSLTVNYNAGRQEEEELTRRAASGEARAAALEKALEDERAVVQRYRSILEAQGIELPDEEG